MTKLTGKGPSMEVDLVQSGVADRGLSHLAVTEKCFLNYAPLPCPLSHERVIVSRMCSSLRVLEVS